MPNFPHLITQIAPTHFLFRSSLARKKPKQRHSGNNKINYCKSPSAALCSPPPPRNSSPSFPPLLSSQGDHNNLCYRHGRSAEALDILSLTHHGFPQKKKKSANTSLVRLFLKKKSCTAVYMHQLFFPFAGKEELMMLEIIFCSLASYWTEKNFSVYTYFRSEEEGILSFSAQFLFPPRRPISLIFYFSLVRVIFTRFSRRRRAPTGS